MSREKFAGQLREVVGALSVALTTWGCMSDEKAAALAGLLTALGMLFWGLNNKEGGAFLMSLIRKVIGAVGAGAVVFGVMTPDKSEAMMGAVLPLLAMWSSARSNGGGDVSAGRFPVVIFLVSLGHLVGFSGVA
jgi:hypothetical protein